MQEVEEIKDFLKSKLLYNHSVQKNLVDNFHKLYYYSQVWKKTTWLNAKVQKCPMDLFVYQEIIAARKPDVIIETGTKYGGSALFMANVCDLIGQGEIITVDIVKEENRPIHKRITYLDGSSVSEAIIKEIQGLIKDKKRIMVILDSDHSKGHVLKELELYYRFVTKDDYLIVEDTNLAGNPVSKSFGAGPYEAVQTFLKTNRMFKIDAEKEKFYLTFNPKGFLRRVK